MARAAVFVLTGSEAISNNKGTSGEASFGGRLDALTGFVAFGDMSRLTSAEEPDEDEEAEESDTEPELDDEDMAEALRFLNTLWTALTSVIAKTGQT